MREVNINIVNTSIEEITNNYVTYEAWKDTQIIYIGVCPFAQIMQFPDMKKIGHFWRLINDSENLSIAIKFIGDRLVCYRKRDVLLRMLPYMPPCNDPRLIGLRSRYICDQDGKIFDSQSACAEYYGIRQSALSSHLAGRAGYRSLKGKTFRRMTE
jgi:hypothetical protein